jgi:hypothetical protein
MNWQQQEDYFLSREEHSEKYCNILYIKRAGTPTETNQIFTAIGEPCICVKNNTKDDPLDRY